MLIDHIAIWVVNIEEMKNFYLKYFDCKTSEKYINKIKNFESYFLSFEGETKVELMHIPDIKNKNQLSAGYTHIALRLGSKKKIDILTERLKQDGFKILSGPRITGDGYYESSFLDPEGNIIELTKKLKVKKK
ncbi:MAG: VOC family protein [Brevinematia bacterium]|mgnify:CR=1 FL=1